MKKFITLERVLEIVKEHGLFGDYDESSGEVFDAYNGEAIVFPESISTYYSVRELKLALGY